MKKIISLLLALILLLSCCLLSSCNDGNTDTVGEIDYSRIKFERSNGPSPLMPKNREEFIEYLRTHQNFWYGCDECRSNMRFESENKIPLKELGELNIPFEYCPNEEPDGVAEDRYGAKILNSVEIKYGAEVDIEAFADCIEHMIQSGKVKSITFVYHAHAADE